MLGSKDGNSLFFCKSHNILRWVFTSYKAYCDDIHHVFATADEAFDYAVNALKEMLAEIGHPVVNGRA